MTQNTIKAKILKKRSIKLDQPRHLTLKSLEESKGPPRHRS